MEVIERARELRKHIESMMAETEDATALAYVELVPAWSGDGTSYTANDRVRYNGVLYRVLQDHTAQMGYTPESAPSLFAEILPGQDNTEPGEWVQPDATNPYNTGDTVIFEGKTYVSLIDGNVWSPSAYPGGWQEVA